MAGRYRAVDFDPDLRARELGDGVEPAFTFVRDQVRYEPYAGALRGAKCAYVTGAANAVDRSLLLARLLEQKGIATRFARGRLANAEAEKLLSRTFEPTTTAAGAPQRVARKSSTDGAAAGPGPSSLAAAASRSPASPGIASGAPSAPPARAPVTDKPANNAAATRFFIMPASLY